MVCCRKGEVIYTPPSGESVIREKLANLKKFINEDNGIDPLIKMALMHYQFEAIHPFADGNGRTGRILLLLYLKLSGLLDIPAIYLSEYIIKNKTAYYQKLRGVTEKEDYISLTDMAKYKNAEIPAHVISHWLSTKYTVEFMGIWETLNNSNFNLTEFREVKNASGGSFTLSPKQWIERTNAIGIVSNAGKC